MRRTIAVLLLLLPGASPLVSQMTAQPVAAEDPLAEPAVDQPVLVGRVDRERIEEAVPEWIGAAVDAAPDLAAAAELARVPLGATVTIYFGTWCSDSRRELTRFWRALDETGGSVGFAIEYVGVDEAKREPADLLAGVELLYVPTFVVRRDGVEIGRIVEESPDGVENDLLALLTGRAHGLRTAKKELLEADRKP